MDNFLPSGWIREEEFHQQAACLLQVSLCYGEASAEVPEDLDARAQLPPLPGLTLPTLVELPSWPFSKRKQRRPLWRGPGVHCSPFGSTGFLGAFIPFRVFSICFPLCLQYSSLVAPKLAVPCLFCLNISFVESLSLMLLLKIVSSPSPSSPLSSLLLICSIINCVSSLCNKANFM